MRMSHKTLVCKEGAMNNHKSNATSFVDLREFICELERVRVSALVARNMTLCEQLHAPEYQLISASGRMFTRERYLTLVESAPFYTQWVPGEMDARIGERMAIVRYEATLELGGDPFQCWHTDSWELVGDFWQAIWSQATKINAPS
jgi:Domain of unknown function (DUF4440)